MLTYFSSAPDGLVWAALSLAIAVAIVFTRSGNLRQLTASRAMEYERRKKRPAPVEVAPDLTTQTLAALDGPEAITFGTLPSGTPLRVRGEIARRSALVLGAPGSGKTRWLLGVLLDLLYAMATGSALEIEVVDVKNESVDLLEQFIGGWLLTWPEREREWLRRHVRVFKFTRERITPLRPYDNRDGVFSDAYLASFRTAVVVDAGQSEYTDATRYARGMWDRVLMDLRWPPSLKVATRFFTDDAFRSRVVIPKIRDPRTRAWAETVGHQSKGTTSALLRRMGGNEAYPQIGAAMNTPPSALDGLMPVQEPGLTLSRVGPDTTLTAAVAEGLCLYRYLDIFASIPTRTPERPLLVAAEELAVTVASSPRLVTPIAQALRTSRSFGVALWALAQDFENAAQTEMAKTFALNARFIVAFQSRDEAAWLAPHLPPDFVPGASDAERKRAFQAAIENLPSRESFVWVKGCPVLRCKSPTVLDPSVQFGRSPEELREVFDREVASRSTISLQTAEALIGQWETDVLGDNGVPSAPDRKAAPRFTSMDDLLRHLGTDDEDADA